MKQLYATSILKSTVKPLLLVGLLSISTCVNAQIMYPGAPVAVGPAAGELVWRWIDDSCSYMNIPDAPVRAFRDAENKINLTIPHFENYRLRGDDFNSLSRDCNLMLGSLNTAVPSEHKGAHWIQSVYTEDGETVHAILHNENFDAGGYGSGNYYSTSACYAVSTDGGATFNLPDDYILFSPSANLSARPFAPLGHDGLQPFSNIFKHNGYYYFYGYITLADHTLMTPANTPLYLFRSDNIADINAWRGWDGSDFTVLLGNAYAESLDLSAMKGVGQDTPWDGAISQLGTNVTWNTYFEKFMMVGISSKSGVYGIYYSLSEDLMNWSERVPLKLFSNAYQMGLDIVPNPSKITVTYPTIIDHDDTSRNFETSDSTVYLYWVENTPSAWGTPHYSYARSIKRQALTLTKNWVHEFVVTSRLDIDDANNGDGLARGLNGASYVNTLRAALSESSHRPPYAINDTLRIRFNIPGSNQTINLGSDLPSTFRVGIDGSTQSGTVLNTTFIPNGMNLAPKINIQGGLLPLRHDSSYIKNVRASQVYMYGENQRLTQSVVQDIVVEGDASQIGGTNANNRIGKIAILGDSIRVEANFIGLDNTGTSSIALDTDPLVRLFGSYNTLSNNLIGGATNQAIQIEPDSANARYALQNIVEDNLIGLSPDAQTQGYIENDAIEIKNGAWGTTVRDNFISGAQHGIYIANAHESSIYRNTIGTEDAGLFGGNRVAGIWITGTSSNNRIGNGNWNSKNTILGNSQQGITFLNLQGEGNWVSENRVEQNPAGALTDPAVFQPNPLIANSVYVTDDADSLIVQCIADTFSMDGLYTLEAYQTAAISGFSEAEHLIASGQFAASELSAWVMSLNEEAYRADLPYICFLLTDPRGNSSILSEYRQILSPSLAPQAALSNQNFTTNSFVETINTEIQNAGNADLNWSVTGTDWAFVEPSSGSIPAGSSAMVSVTLFRGDYCGALTDTLILLNNSFSNSALPLVVHMDAYPEANITHTTSLEICPGGSVLLRGTQGNDFQYAWYRNGISLGISTQNYMATTAGDYQVVITAGTCVDTSEIKTVSIGGNLSASITAPGNTNLCGGQSVNLQANTGTGYAYQWLLNNVPIGGATQSQYTANSPGNYAIRITSGGCTVTSSPLTINSGTPPPASVTANGSPSVCSGQSVGLNANTGSGLSYQWMLNGNPINGANTASYNASQSGNYQVNVTSNGCTNTSSAVAVTVNPIPTATASASTATTFCEGGSVALNANTGAGLSYQWKLNGNAISGANSASFTASSTGNYTVQVTAAGCENTSSAVAVTVNPIPTATASAATATTFCEGGTVALNANTGAGFSYQWKLNENAISGANASTYIASSAGNYTVQVTAAGCENTSSAVAVTVNPIPTATASAATATTFCEGGTVALNANTGAGLSYQWKLNGNAISGANASTYTASSAGNYTVQVTAAGCENTSSAVAVTVNPIPTATASAATATTFCEGGSVALNANTGAGFSYQWKLNGNAISGANASTYTASSTGNYTVQVTAAGCENTSSAVAVMVNTIPTATASAATATTFCEGGSVALNANTGTGFSYQWKLNGNSISGANAVSYTASSTGNYTVQVTAAGCENTSSAVAVMVNPIPTATASAATATTFCEGGSVALNANTGAGLSYQWKLNGNAISGANSAEIIVNQSGAYSVLVSDGVCEATSAEIVVTAIAVADAPSLELVGNYIVATGDGIPTWYLNGVAIEGEQSDSIEVMAEGVYTCVLNAETCPSAVSNEIYIIPLRLNSAQIDVEIFPNPTSGMVQLAQGNWEWIEIYNASGQLVESHKQTGNSVNLNALSNGVYFIKMEIDSRISVKRLVLQH